jgi:2-polyprenyl-6-methoxyphenol hydroxylase-like FAD-dependent oxidoreductase
MQREERTDVLVTGAGPVGMLTALLLADAGVQVRIVDQESRTASHSYACALHSRTLRILDRLGLSQAVLDQGLRIGAVAFYEGTTRRAELKLDRLSGDYPFILVLPQSAFEELLQDRLRQQTRVRIDWNHRLAGLQPERESVSAAVEKLGVSAKGYIVPEMEWSVQKAVHARAAYVIGADGPNSAVAQMLGVGFTSVRQPEFFAVYEFQSDWTGDNELRVVLNRGTVSVLWPLAGNRFRWSFQLLEEHQREFPLKERSSMRVSDPELEQANRAFVEKLVRERAPWFEGRIEELDWSTDVEFHPRMANRFGQERCWLVGDAAHQTSPAGMQSMNLGLVEADQLSAALIKVLRGKVGPEALLAYDECSRKEWRRLLGLESSLRPGAKTDPWVKEHASTILSCLPASGEDLAQLLKGLELELA